MIINSSRHFRCKGESIFNTLSDRLVRNGSAFLSTHNRQPLPISRTLEVGATKQPLFQHFLPEIVKVEFSALFEDLNVSNSQKDNFSNLILGIDKTVAFGIVDSTILIKLSSS